METIYNYTETDKFNPALTNILQVNDPEEDEDTEDDDLFPAREDIDEEEDDYDLNRDEEDDLSLNIEDEDEIY